MNKVLVARDDAIIILSLNDPDRRNVLSRDMCRDLSAAIAVANSDESVKAVVLTGKGKAFCAGAELGDLKAASLGDDNCLAPVYGAFVDILRSPLPTIAAVNGPAVGAGFNLALACDMRIAGESASFETRFLHLGLHPGGGHGWMLLRSIGWQAANWMLLTGQPANGREAERLGLAIKCVADSNLFTHAVNAAKRIAAAPRELITRTKATLAVSSTTSHDLAFRHESAEQLWSLRQNAFRDAISGAR